MKTNSEEFAERTRREAQRLELWQKAFTFAQEFWKRLVEKVGESQAKEMMAFVIGNKKSGPDQSPEDNALHIHIYFTLLSCGPKQSDEKIATHICASDPHFVRYQSGMVAVASNDIPESELSFDDDPIVGRSPINISIGTMKKRVQRFRSSAIAENALSKQFAPKPYNRD